MRGLRVKLPEHPVQFIHGLTQRLVGVPLKRLVTAMLVGIGENQRQLTDEILDVMGDEGKALVELDKLARFGERFARFQFREIARDLTAHDFEKIDVLPRQDAMDAWAADDDKPE